jgi:RHS repeat-associated protein
LPDGNYRVRVDKFSGQYFSGESNHCETPTCNSIDVIVPVYGIVTATVLDSENEPQEGLNVTVLDGSTTVGSAVMTNSSGQALFNLPEGSYRFNTEYHSQQYYSGVDNHCTVPTCTTASLTVPVYRVVTVSVVDTANAIQSGLTVTAYAGDTATDVTAITDENGQASLTLPGGSYRFATVKNGFAAFSGTSNHCTIPACTTASITVPVFSGVTVTVVDSAAVPQANAPVFTYNGDDPTGYNSITDASGQATLNLPEGSYRFRATTHDLNYFSGTENNCTVPTCTTAQLSIPQFGQVSVTVTDTDNAPLGGLAVYAYQGDQSTGLSAITNAYGQATLTLPEGNYHFRTTLHTLEYRSSSTDTCAVTTCTEAAIQTPVFGEVTVTVQDTANTAQANLTVTAMNGDTATTIQGITDTNGQATLALPEGDYRFRASLNGLDYFSADANHCTIPTCTTAAISVPVFGQVIISVVNSAATAQADLPVYAYRVVTSTVQPTSTATATPEPTEEPTQEPTEQPEENIATLTELVETGNSGTTDANGQVVMTLPEGTYRFRTDLFGHQYYSSEENPVVVPADTTASITVPVFAEVEVTVTDRDHEIQPNLTVYAYDGETYTGASAVTDSSGKVKLTLPEGNYRFRADQYDLQFWSNTNNHCAVPACAAASVTVLGADYTAGDQTITYTYDPLNRLTAADYDSGTYYHYTYDAVGNRTAQDSAINTVSTQHTYAYDNANRLTAVDNQAYTFDANGNLLSDGVYTYTYDSANRLTGLSKDGTAVTYGYNGLGDRLKQTVNGDEKDFSLDLNAGLTQVLAYGGDTYLYGLNRLGYDNQGETYQYLTDALGSARQVTKSGVTNAGLTLTKSYDPYGNVIYSNGAETSYGFTGEWQDNTTNRMVYLRARLYSPETGRFLTKDSWTGDNKTPMSYNEWLYGYANPIIWIDSAGFSAFIYGIQIDDNFSEDEKTLISETISDYIQLLGSQVKLMNNFSLSAIKQGWTNYAGAYNAQYNLATHTITLQPGWYSPVITQAPNGDVHIILSSLCGKDLEKMLNFPEGSLPTAKIAAKFVLAHEMGHSFQIGNPDAFRTFKNYVNLPWSFFARFSKNPIIKRNQDRDLASEVFADMMAAYLYSPGLLNQQMSDWMQLKMPGMLK